MNRQSIRVVERGARVAALTVFTLGASCLQPTIEAGSQPKPAPAVNPTPEAVCGFNDAADPSRALLATVSGKELRFVRADRTQVVVHSFGAQGEVDPESVAVDSVVARNGRIAAAATYYGRAGEVYAEVVLLDEHGQRLWLDLKPGAWRAALFLNEQGILAVAYGDRGGALVLPDRVLRFEERAPLAEVSADGHVPLENQNSEHPREWGWLEVATGRLTPSFQTDPTVRHIHGWSEGWLIHLARSADVPVLVMERPGTARVIPLAADAGAPFPLLQDAASGRVLFAGPGLERNQLQVINTGDATVSKGAVVAPSGYTWSGFLEIDEDGSLIGVFHRGDEDRLFRSMDLGASWEPLGGEPLKAAGDEWLRPWKVEVTRTHGTLLVSSHYAVYGFMFRPDLVRAQAQPVERALDGSPWFFASKHAAGGPDSFLSGDGQCVLRFERKPDSENSSPMVASEGRVSAVEVVTGQSVEVLEVDQGAPVVLWIL